MEKRDEGVIEILCKEIGMEKNMLPGRADGKSQIRLLSPVLIVVILLRCLFSVLSNWTRLWDILLTQKVTRY